MDSFDFIWKLSFVTAVAAFAGQKTGLRSRILMEIRSSHGDIKMVRDFGAAATRESELDVTTIVNL